MGVLIANIRWEASGKEICEALDKLSLFDASEILGVSIKEYAHMDKYSVREYDARHFNSYPGALADLLEIPRDIKIPEEFGVTDTRADIPEVISWIYDIYGRRMLEYQLKKVK